ncbi:MAG: NUDIX domain-containing protein [Patescibacteria group bacterium]
MIEHQKQKKRFLSRHSPSRPSSAEAGQPAKKEITAGLIVFRKTFEGPKYLLLYHRGSYWNFPKGHVEKEEGSLEAAIRETTEETGLRRSDLRILPNFKTHERFFFRKEKETIFKIVIIFLAETREKNVKISDEHQGYGWFLFNDAKKILGKYRENWKTLVLADDFLHFKGKSRPAAGGAARRFPPRPPFVKK